MRELDEALMDRTTASQNRKHRIINIQSSSSNQEVARSEVHQASDEVTFNYRADYSVTGKS